MLSKQKVEQIRREIESLRRKGGVSAEDYLKEPYQRILIPEPEAGGYSAMIAEFPGCFAEGDTADEAIKNLDQVAMGWIRAVQDSGQAVPPPLAENKYGGKVLVRFPKSTHKEAALAAEREGVSLNQFVVASVAEKIGRLAGRSEEILHSWRQAAAVICSSSLSISSSLGRVVIRDLPVMDRVQGTSTKLDIAQLPDLSTSKVEGTC